MTNLVDSLVGYVDILGMSHAININRDNPEKLEELSNILYTYQRDALEFFRKYSEKYSSHYDGPEPVIKIFSDSILLYYPITQILNIPIKAILGSLTHFQLYLAESGYASRGAVVRGKAYFDKIISFGPAILDAYYLESKCAIFPRIIISSEVCEIVHKRHIEVGPDSEWEDTLIMDTDGFTYLNYLYLLKQINDASKRANGSIKGYDPKIVERLRHHKKWILSSISSSYDKPDIQQKYFWLEQYHESFCSYYFPDLTFE